MMLSWMIWTSVVGLVLTLGALALDQVLGYYKRPSRWVWVIAMVGTVALPLLRILSPGTATSSVPVPGAPILLEPLVVGLTAQPVVQSASGTVGLLWAFLSAAFFVSTVLGFSRIRRMRREWVGDELLGTPVLVSDEVGPAVVGVVKPEVVLPAWVMDAPEPDQELILLHEKEHMWAGDSRLRFLMGLILFAAPWNLALWWQARRLDRAIEVDCDRRVMARTPNLRREYGGLLLSVGIRQSGLELAGAVSLVNGQSLLEQRLNDLTRGIPRGRVFRAGVLATSALALLVVACMAPAPTAPMLDVPPTADARPAPPVLPEVPPPSVEEPVLTTEQYREEPTFTPFTVRPDIRNRSVIGRALEEEYPQLLRDAGIGGTATVWFFIDEQGTVLETRINNSSGHVALDEAALRVAQQFEYTPAMNRDQPVPVWIALDITFTTN